MASSSRRVKLTPTFAFRVSSSERLPCDENRLGHRRDLQGELNLRVLPGGHDHLRMLRGRKAREGRGDPVFAEAEVQETELSALGRRRGERRPHSRQRHTDPWQWCTLFVRDLAVDIPGHALCRGHERPGERDQGHRDRETRKGRPRTPCWFLHVPSVRTSPPTGLGGGVPLPEGFRICLDNHMPSGQSDLRIYPCR